MPLSSTNFPNDITDLLTLVLKNRGFVPSAHAPSDVFDRLDKQLTKFWHDFKFQLLPNDLVVDYCRAVAQLVNETLFEYVDDNPPAMWDMAKDLLTAGGLVAIPPLKTQSEFYRYAGYRKPAYDLANHIFSGHWH